MGGKVFLNKETGYNPAIRIPVENVNPVAKSFLFEFESFFDKIELVSSVNIENKKDHGDIDFVVLPKNSRTRQEFKEFLEKRRKDFFSENYLGPYSYKSNGRMDHILYYPFYIGNYIDIDNLGYGYLSMHQVDLIWAKNENDFKNKIFFYSNPTTFNAVVGHFARSIGYKFSDQGLFIHVTDKKDQNFFVFLTDKIEEMLRIMMLDYPDQKYLFEEVDNFVQWIIKSPKFDSDLFNKKFNHQSRHDVKKDTFCEKVYNSLSQKNIKCKIKPVKIDFSKEYPNLDELLCVEKEILGKKIVEEIKAQIDERSKIATPVISGKTLIEMGFKPGPLFGQIIQEVSEIFEIEDELEEKKNYIYQKFGNPKEQK